MPRQGHPRRATGEIRWPAVVVSHVTDATRTDFPALATLQRPRGFAEHGIRAKRTEAHMLYGS